MITCPFTNQIVNTTFIDPRTYPYWIKKGFGIMFEEDVKLTKKTSKDDISKS